ncbi:hypothetical protein [Acinetobacter junii]|uniref:hypothetical protein n=1 Tax=Acinetobacter junii TaxID=40215 RepID=UPI00124F561B|nr:hypothetical protein [Acinetobacter junii]
MVDIKTGRIVSQEDWKRTQVRMPKELYEDLVKYAEEKSISLNTAMITLMTEGMIKVDKVDAADGMGLPPYSTTNKLNGLTSKEFLDYLAENIAKRLKEK